MYANRWLVLAPLLGLVACGRQDSTGVVPEYHAETGELTRLTLDANHDGRPEMTASMRGANVQVVEVDENRDGQTDRWEYFADRALPGGSRGEAPRLVRVERLLREGSTVRREGFEGGQLVWAREDRDGDGRDDRWETYRDGALVSVAFDTAGRGLPDRVLRYADGASGTLTVERAQNAGAPGDLQPSPRP